MPLVTHANGQQLLLSNTQLGLPSTHLLLTLHAIFFLNLLYLFYSRFEHCCTNNEWRNWTIEFLYGLCSTAHSGTFQLLYLNPNTNVNVFILRSQTYYFFQLTCRITRLTTVILSLEFCISMLINLYIARSTHRFTLFYTCGLTAVIKRIWIWTVGCKITDIICCSSCFVLCIKLSKLGKTDSFWCHGIFGEDCRCISSWCWMLSRTQQHAIWSPAHCSSSSVGAQSLSIHWRDRLCSSRHKTTTDGIQRLRGARPVCYCLPVLIWCLPVLIRHVC